MEEWLSAKQPASWTRSNKASAMPRSAASAAGKIAIAKARQGGAMTIECGEQTQDGQGSTKTVHLIHGTWPYGLLAHRLKFLRNGPLWFEEGSLIRADIAARVGPSVRFVTFVWSGDNSFVARARAAEAFAAHLRKAIDADTASTHLIVGHSHGGTVAVEAMQRDPTLAAAGVAGILTLATPFVSLHPPPSARWERAVLSLVARFAPYMALLVSLIGWAAFDHAPEVSYAATFARLVTTGVFLLIVLHASNFLPWFPMPGRRFASNLIDHPLPALGPGTQLFAIRAPRDEASLAIAAGQVVGVLSDVMWRLLIYAPIAAVRRNPIKVPVMLVVLYALFAWLGVRETAEIHGIERVISVALYASFLMCAAYTVPVLIAFVVLFPASVALALAAGVEVLAMPGLLTVDAEPLPAGGTTRQLLILDLPDSDQERLLMRHSIYELSTARKEVAQWIKRTLKAGNVTRRESDTPAPSQDRDVG